MTQHDRPGETPSVPIRASIACRRTWFVVAGLALAAWALVGTQSLDPRDFSTFDFDPVWQGLAPLATLVAVAGVAGVLRAGNDPVRLLGDAMLAGYVLVAVLYVATPTMLICLDPGDACIAPAAFSISSLVVVVTPLLVGAIAESALSRGQRANVAADSAGKAIGPVDQRATKR